MIMSLAYLSCSICLIRAIKTTNKKLMLPWMSISTFGICYLALALVFSIVKVPAVAIWMFAALG
jgi:hypothetical protein